MAQNDSDRGRVQSVQQSAPLVPVQHIKQTNTLI